MAKKQRNLVLNGEIQEEVKETKAARKTKFDYIPEDMIDEFNAIQAELAKKKGGNKRTMADMTPEELEAKRQKTLKRLQALEAALKG